MRFLGHECLEHTLYSAAKLRIFSQWNDRNNCPLDELRGINDEVRGLLFEEERVALDIVKGYCKVK